MHGQYVHFSLYRISYSCVRLLQIWSESCAARRREDSRSHGCTRTSLWTPPKKVRPVCQFLRPSTCNTKCSCFGRQIEIYIERERDYRPNAFCLLNRYPTICPVSVLKKSSHTRVLPERIELILRVCTSKSWPATVLYYTIFYRY